jgi:hypothetical protein
MREFALIYFSSPFLLSIVDLTIGVLEFIEAIAGSSCVAKITVLYEMETYEF